MPDERPVFWGYARVSTNKQDISIEAQSKKIEDYYWGAFATTHRFGGVVSEQVSGKIPMTKRPEGAKLIAQLNEQDVFCITKLDRGWRSTIHFGASIDWFRWKKVQCVVMDLQLDTSTPMGKFAAVVIAAMAEAERERIGERTREVIRHQKETGTYVGARGWRRYGYRYLGRTEVTRKPKYEPNYVQRGVMKKAIQMHQGELQVPLSKAITILKRSATPDVMNCFPRTCEQLYQWASAELTLQAIEKRTNGGKILLTPPSFEDMKTYKVTLEPVRRLRQPITGKKRKTGGKDVPKIF